MSKAVNCGPLDYNQAEGELRCDDEEDDDDDDLSSLFIIRIMIINIMIIMIINIMTMLVVIIIPSRAGSIVRKQRKEAQEESAFQLHEE